MVETSVRFGPTKAVVVTNVMSQEVTPGVDPIAELRQKLEADAAAYVCMSGGGSRFLRLMLTAVGCRWVAEKGETGNLNPHLLFLCVHIAVKVSAHHLPMCCCLYRCEIFDRAV